MRPAALSIAAILILSLNAPLSVRASPQTTFEATHFPSTMTFAGFSNSSSDFAFVDMLKQAGVSTIVIEQDPITFIAQEARYSALIQYVHSQGLKVHLINQMDLKTRLNLLGEKNPLQTLIPPSKAKILSYETQWIQLYASFHPDYLTVLAEPSNLNLKMRVGLIDTDWNAIISSLVQTAKSISPQTQTWVDLVPSPLIVDYHIGVSAIGIQGLDGIGWDIYNGTSPGLSSIVHQEAQGGKLVGVTETWWKPLVSQPRWDSPVYAANESAWFGQLYDKALNDSVVPSLFNPFFTSHFVTLAPQPAVDTPTTLRAYSAMLQTALSEGNRTVDFTSYQSLIATN